MRSCWKWVYWIYRFIPQSKLQYPLVCSQMVRKGSVTLQEQVAKWLRRWTRDLGFSIPAVLVMCKSLGQAVNPHRLCPPSSYGYQVERKIGTVWMATAAENCAAFSPGRWDCERVSSRYKFRSTYGDIWNINMHLYLYREDQQSASIQRRIGSRTLL